ncbi:MAG: hypothetical protein JW840_07185 [Candidatus Thermoplasmatota archaeon]|nr:hypothetical protein [Candidatus Thermoplasmatota archaeon]
MPGRDGTGPTGRGPLARGGRGQGRGRGLGGGYSRGPSGDCVCPNCGHREPHQVQVPCYTIKCKKCGTFMTRL